MAAGLNLTQVEEVQRMIGASTNERLTTLERVQLDLRETTQAVVVELKAKLDVGDLEVESSRGCRIFWVRALGRGWRRGG